MSARYFDTMGMQILRGPWIRATAIARHAARRRDQRDARTRQVRRPAIRSAAASRSTIEGEQERPFTVVGVVRDSKYNDLRDEPPQPDDLGADRAGAVPGLLDLIAHGARRRGVRRAPCQEVLRATDPDIMVRNTTTLSAEVAGKTSRERLLLGLSSGFAGRGDAAGGGRPLRHAGVHGQSSHA